MAETAVVVSFRYGCHLVGFPSSLDLVVLVHDLRSSSFYDEECNNTIWRVEGVEGGRWDAIHDAAGTLGAQRPRYVHVDIYASRN